MKISEINGKLEGIKYKVLINNESIPCDITIINNKDSAHALHISIEDVQLFANQLESPLETYTKSFFQILAGDTNSAFVCVQNNQVTFNKSKNIKYFSKKAKQVDYIETLQKVADHLYCQNCEQRQEIFKLTSQNNCLSEELEKVQENLDTVIENAKSHEEQLYSCFIQVLNEKKKFIRNLKFHIDEKQLRVVESSTSCKRPAEVSDSDSEYNTDEDEGETNRKIQKVSDNVEPSTSKEGIANTKSRSIENILDSDNSEDEIFATALPPRSVKLSIEMPEIRNGRDVRNKINESNVHNVEDTKTRKLADDLTQKKSNENTEKALIENTPVVTYNTQDLIDDF